MGINAVASSASSAVAVTAKPVAIQEEAVSVSSVNSQSVRSVQKNSATLVLNRTDDKQDSTTDSTTTTKQLSESELAKVTDEINTFMESMNTDIHFVLHNKTNELMVQVQSGKNHKVVKEFPAHELLDAVARMRDYIGALVDKKA